MKIPLARPDVPYEEVAADLQRILESGILTRGDYVKRFERAVADYVGTRHAFATTSATTALHLALLAAGVGPGDEVLVADFTFPASGNVIVQTGATPVLVDCLPDQFVMDVEDARRKVSARTRAIMPVDAFGQPADMEEVSRLADEHGLFVVEDAACALGASWKGRRCGSWPGAGCLSFHPRKIITTGEGGMVTTNDDHLASRIEVLRNHGGVPDGIAYRFDLNGFNYRLSEVQAALGIPQVKRLRAIVADRQATAALYQQRLAGLPGVAMPLAAAPDCVTFQSLVVMLDGSIDRDAVISGLRQREIETTLGTYAMHAHPAFSRYGYRPGDLPHSWRAERQSLTLPLLPRMSSEQVDEVVTSLTEVMDQSADR